MSDGAITHSFECPVCNKQAFAYKKDKENGYMKKNHSEFARDISYQCKHCYCEFKTREIYSLSAPKTVRKHDKDGSLPNRYSPFDMTKLASSIAKASFGKSHEGGMSWPDCIKMARTVHASLNKSGAEMVIDSHLIGDMVLATLYHQNRYATFVRYLIVFKKAENRGLTGIDALIFKEQDRIIAEYRKSTGRDTLLDPQGKQGIEAEVLEHTPKKIEKDK